MDRERRNVLIRPHHLINLKQYYEDPSINQLFALCYGSEQAHISDLVFEDILSKEVDVTLILEDDVLCCGNCRARGRKGCWLCDEPDGPKKYVSRQYVLNQDLQALRELKLRGNVRYSSETVLAKLGINS